MSTARDFLAAVQQRADRKVLWPAMSPEKASDLVAALNDRRRLAAALTAALDLADEWRASNYPIRNQDEHDLRAVIADVLTLKENDS